ncbi:hypothetical protein BH09PLA1_BH09PLA1_04290 [soil metagenome]
MKSDKRIDAAKNPSWITIIVVALLLMIAAAAVYLPWSVITGKEYVGGADHIQLHSRRMEFAREHLLGPDHRLPAWYPRELLGTPFRANLQNFPWIPTRLLVLWLIDPESALGIGAALSSALAALFTMLFCRRLGMGRIASAAAGWTFACCGFYSSRVLAGHLPLLEAYPALPTLLWLTDRALAVAGPRACRIDWQLIALALATMCFALAGHPQLTVYSLAFASFYALAYRKKSLFARGGPAVLAMLIGAGMAGFALYPMAALTGRTTRVLKLDRATNDVAMPLGRLAAMVLPWRDGWPPMVKLKPHVEFTGYPNYAYYWDTINYIGWTPLLAVIALVILVPLGCVPVGRRGMLIALMGIIALALSLPVWHALMSNVPGTFLRSPARLMYVVGFVLSIALGTAIDQLMRWSSSIGPGAPGARFAPVIVVVLVLGMHAVDLAGFARRFIVTSPVRGIPFPTAQYNGLLTGLREGRVGFDYVLPTPLNRKLDDIGFFDSIILAKPYRFVMDTSGYSETENTQAMDGGEMSPRTLRAAGVKVLWTNVDRPDLPLIGRDGNVKSYTLRNADDRVRFFSYEQIFFESTEQIHRLLRVSNLPLNDRLYLSRQDEPKTPPPRNETPLIAELRYGRPSSDEMIVHVTTDRPGYVRLLESWDPGWSATVDGAPAPILAGNDVFITVPISPGTHELRLIYRTPGAKTGIVISVLCAVLLVGFAIVIPRLQHRG